ncbi:radical SAM protein, partial [bacterium]|nr:radical SAM protein [bacterium]
VSPIIPGLIDLKDIIKKTKDFTEFYWFEIINIKLAGREFVNVLRSKSPKSLEIITDKKKLENFLKKCENIINSEDIDVRGIEIH